MSAATALHRTPTILQLEAVECGAAALAMVLAYHGRHVPLEQVRIECGVTRDGSKASGVLRAARGHGLVARGFKKEPDEVAELPLPAIAFVNFNHFVVVEGFRDGRVHLNDPARGRRVVDGAEFDQAFTGVVLTFEKGADFEPGGEAPSVVRSLGQYLEGLRLSVALAFMVGLTLVLPGLALPWLLGRFVDEVLVAHASSLAWPLLGGLALAILARALLLALQARLVTNTFGQAARASARRFVAHALSLPMAFYAQRSPGELAARVELNERVAQTLSHDLARLVLDLLTASFFLVLMVRLEASLALAVVACLALEVVAWRALAARTAEISQELSVQAGKLAGVATGSLANIEGIKAGGQENALFLKWIGLQVQYLNASLRAQRFMLTLGQAPALLGLVAALSVLGLGAVRIMQGTLTVGDLVAFQVLLAGFAAPVHALFTQAQHVQSLRGDLARLDDVLHHQTDPTTPIESWRVFPGSPIALEFRGITFGYDRGAPPLIESLSLQVPAGARIAIVGASGSGKSTLGRLAAGLHAPWSGEILLNGEPRSSWPRGALARAVGYVDQDVVLFEGTVRENLSLWDERISDAALEAALHDAALHREILRRPGGLEAPLHEAARNLSGGQRQRLEIARALALRPSLLILDEATSALDTATEARVASQLRKRRITCLVIAHRLSTLRDADEIVVIDQGRIVERGTHAALAARAHGRYAALVASEAA
ncbi:MAG TPA: NHLP family bacteriocin export ABC transporter peptidase/permease/ATPase subunit [Usitatibacter sp.]|jgi:NHLM bacteriocin system ABC transporter peptidase/ATP-binding protein|nr:NHLP family bacteriocin export ABC transporter peptidase/permease/ATPase subunit [Usitatibacter sp.]